jgi:hypothetical protein
MKEAGAGRGEQREHFVPGTGRKRRIKRVSFKDVIAALSYQ